MTNYKMSNYKLTIQYDGGRYKGWQRLGNDDNTIQGKIEKAISDMVGHSVEIIGSSRTDAGVHALEQIANFKIKEDMPISQMQSFLNHYLPRDISITNVEQVDDRFHARYHSVEKTYLYRIWNRPFSHPFMRKYSMHVAKKLDLDKMRQAGRYYVGEHDFTAYSNSKSHKKNMVRKIHELVLEETEGMIVIRIRGNGFLYHMVRKMVGTLIEVGWGEINPDQIPLILQSRERVQTGGMAEAHGFYLEHIRFRDDV